MLRWLGILLVLGLGAMAVALVVLGDSQKQLRIGVLLGIWAAVVAYFLPSRREEQPQAVATGHDPSRVYNDVGIRTAPDPRREFREYQAQLERTFRRDMDQALSEHLARLRGEVALLRNDLVEQVNGQLRLERTETTRALGSDIEGLQQEIRRLAASREYLTSVPTLTATRETVTVAAAPGDASGAGQRSVPRVVSSPPARPVTGHAGLGDASTGSATGVPPADRFDSGPARRSDGQPATARRVAASDAFGDATAGDAAFGHVTSGNAAIGDVPSRDAIIGDPAPGDATSRAAAPRGIAASECDPTGSGGSAPFPGCPTTHGHAADPLGGVRDLDAAVHAPAAHAAATSPAGAVPGPRRDTGPASQRHWSGGVQ